MKVNIGEYVVAYVPWQTPLAMGWPKGPIIEGRVIGKGDRVGIGTVVAIRPFNRRDNLIVLVHEKWLYPEKLRGRVRFRSGDRTTIHYPS